jgi:DNA-binding transcriptional MerR regulator
MDARIPDKLYFRIGEVANLASLRPSVLRFWETEFEALAPAKSRTGQRLYTRKELELVLEIRRLLYTEKLTIEGARKRLKSKGCLKNAVAAKSGSCPDEVMTIINDVKEQLKEIRNSI